MVLRPNGFNLYVKLPAPPSCAAAVAKTAGGWSGALPNFRFLDCAYFQSPSRIGLFRIFRELPAALGKLISSCQSKNPSHPLRRR